MESLNTAAAWVGMISGLATACALVVAVWQLRTETQRARRQRRFDVYNELTSQYGDFLRQCVEHPWVDCFDKRLPETRLPRDAVEERAEAAAFLALISLIERAYVFYRRELEASDDWVVTQWPGWESYACGMASRARFRAAWMELRGEFDTAFARWMDGLVAGCGSGGSPGAATADAAGSVGRPEAGTVPGAGGNPGPARTSTMGR